MVFVDSTKTQTQRSVGPDDLGVENRSKQAFAGEGWAVRLPDVCSVWGRDSPKTNGLVRGEQEPETEPPDPLKFSLGSGKLCSQG